MRLIVQPCDEDEDDDYFFVLGLALQLFISGGGLLRGVCLFVGY
jgi:hypothetical protein